MSEEQHTIPDQEDVPEQRQGFRSRLRWTSVIAKLVYLFMVLIMILSIIFLTNNAAVRGITNWFRSNFEYDYPQISCLDGEHRYLLTDGGNHIYGGNGQPIILYNCAQAKDPTWDELEAFLWHDKTDEETYIEREIGESSFVCADYAEMLHNNAEKVGIKAAYVTVLLPSHISHALNAFETVDMGRVYIDSTGVNESVSYPCSLDKIVNIEVGKKYIGEHIFSCYGYTLTAVSKGVVTDLLIRW